MGDRNVYTRVSWRSMLKMMGNILPGGKRWFDRLDLRLDCY